jgi:ferrous-iron efflux pump FieF
MLVSATDQGHRLVRQATMAAVVVAVALAVAKLIAVWLSGSVALLASALDSALDASASMINAVAVRYAQKPADDDHRFGHGKSEALAGLAQTLLITGSGVFVVQHAIARLIHPRPLQLTGAGLVILVVALLATLALVLFQRHAVRVTGSQAVKADALHYASDLASNSAAIIALALARAGVVQADPWLAIIIALATFYGAVAIAREVLQVLMDRELPAQTQQRIRFIVLSHGDVRGLHALRTRRSGPTTLIQFHLELDPQMPIRDAERVANEVAGLLECEFHGADVLIHQDPASAPANTNA